jgi:hypothetical protein
MPEPENIGSGVLLNEMLIYSKPFGLSLSKPLKIQGLSFDKLRANGINNSLNAENYLAISSNSTSKISVELGGIPGTF